MNSKAEDLIYGKYGKYYYRFTNMFRLYVGPCSTLEKYLALPLEQREVRVWWWPTKWYVPPYAMEMKSAHGCKWLSEWDRFDNYTREHYPVQRWLREDVYDFFVYTVAFNYRELKRKIKHRIKNPRKKMRDAVFPFTYWDLQTHIVEFHVQCIIEFVEREKCFDVISWDWNEEVKRTGKELKEAYEYCKTGRAKLIADVDKAFDNVPNDKPYAEAYREVNRAEAWLKECDDKLCTWVIQNRESLWT